MLRYCVTCSQTLWWNLIYEQNLHGSCKTVTFLGFPVVVSPIRQAALGRKTVRDVKFKHTTIILINSHNKSQYITLFRKFEICMVYFIMRIYFSLKRLLPYGDDITEIPGIMSQLLSSISKIRCFSLLWLL